VAAELDFLNNEIIARELLRKTQGCAFMWEQESPSSFRSASFESRTGKPDVYWEFVLSQVGEGD